MVPPEPWTGIQIGTTLRTSWLVLYLCTPTIVIDGKAERHEWGLHTFPLDCGLHHLQIFFRYLCFDVGEASMNVVVKHHQVNRIVYKAPWSFFFSASITELPPYRFDNVENTN